MNDAIEIEDIAEMRHVQAIEDDELSAQIEHLGRGDFVKLTFLRALAGETLLVRITSVRGGKFRGKLEQKPGRQLAPLRLGCPVVFTKAHIHSIAKGP